MKKICLFSFIVSFLVLSCAAKVDDMMEDYNKNYVEVAEVGPDPVPGDKDFFQEDMLLPNYTVDMRSTINLVAPDGCSSYEWGLYTIDEDLKRAEKVKFVSQKAIASETNRYFELYIPDENIQPGTFELLLRVTGNDNVTYEDSCGLIVCRYLP